MTRRTRLDAELVRRGMARSRQHAVELVTAGKVSVAGMVATKVTTAVDAAAPVVVDAESGNQVVSRGAHKLAGALDHWTELQVDGRGCLDAGASTGGFTQVLLERGAAHVVAVDVGYGQLAWSLRTDDRVEVLDRTNVRNLTVADLGAPVSLTVADLSFVSLTLVLPSLIACTEAAGDMLVMVKPQFEVGRERVGKGGVVRDPAARMDAVLQVGRSAQTRGWGTVGVVASPLPGPAGNVEYFLWLRHDCADISTDDVRRAVEDGPQ